ncbi:MAG TPA: sulfur oxidation c-type cytochrome SoxA [Rhodocyclaceae bacterium]|nr:sulfur oxidation c-type cytochrome SoxA [Rhodocyclaceae bacterium]
MNRALILGAAVLLAAGIPNQYAVAQAGKSAKKPSAAHAKSKQAAEFEQFHEELEQDNPAELFELKGEELWKAKRGPKHASLEQCDLGLGPGVVKGAYVQMPRYFADVGQVMDAERRIVHCMVTLQGFKEADLAKQPFSTPDRTPDPVSLVAYVAAQSRGMKIATPQKTAQEREAYAVGREIFNYRAGPYDFSCATCHGQEGKRIRSQQLPDLASKKEAIKGYQGWPGYRLTGGLMHTLQWRMNDCFRQQRFPEPGYVSETITDLLTYLAVNANGHVYKGPGIKR